MASNPVPVQSAGQALNSEQQTWIYTQFNGTTFQANAMDVQHEPLYDENTFTAGSVISVPTQFFTNPAGKNLNQTNVTTAKRLDAPEAFAVMGINFTWQENILLADAIGITANFALELWIGQKYYNRAPCSFYNGGRGIYGSSTTSGFSVLTNGAPLKGHRHELGINIVIDNQASFYAQLTGSAYTLTASGSGGVGAILYDLLDGLHARGVQ